MVQAIQKGVKGTAQANVEDFSFRRVGNAEFADPFGPNMRVGYHQVKVGKLPFTNYTSF